MNSMKWLLSIHTAFSANTTDAPLNLENSTGSSRSQCSTHGTKDEKAPGSHCKISRLYSNPLILT